MAHSLVSQFAILALLAICAFAFVKGGTAERWGAALICVSWLGGDAISFLLHQIFSRQVLELTLLAMDAVLAVGFLVLALRFTKIWLGVAMLMQSGELALHGAAMGDWGLPFIEYALLNNLLSFGLLLILLVATLVAWLTDRRKKRAEPAASR